MVNEHESTNFITRLNKLDENKTKRSLTIYISSYLCHEYIQCKYAAPSTSPRRENIKR